jgi:hypothetical protein
MYSCSWHLIRILLLFLQIHFCLYVGFWWKFFYQSGGEVICP